MYKPNKNMLIVNDVCKVLKMYQSFWIKRNFVFHFFPNLQFKEIISAGYDYWLIQSKSAKNFKYHIDIIINKLQLPAAVNFNINKKQFHWGLMFNSEHHLICRDDENHCYELKKIYISNANGKIMLMLPSNFSSMMTIELNTCSKLLNKYGELQKIKANPKKEFFNRGNYLIKEQRKKL